MLDYLPLIAAAVLCIVLLIVGYVKAPPDKVVIISGARKKPRMIVGKASYRIPFFERIDTLSLRLIPIDVKTASAVPTADYININIDAAVNIKISANADKLQLAAQNFLNRDEAYIANVSREVLEGNMREIVGQMGLREMVSSRQMFADRVRENAVPDLEKMGLDIVSFNVQNFTDSNGVIEDLGIDNISQIKKAAAIAKAESERDVDIARADAARKANDAKVESDTQIAVKQNELAIKRSELQQTADVKRAAADAAYSIEEQEQRKSVEIAKANANIAKTEREIELQEKQVSVQKHVLDAQVREQAEAERFAREQKAEAELFEQRKVAEARKFAAQQDAEARKAEADAARFAKEQEAQGIRAVGQAEAEAIRAKGLAEAEGIDKKAEAMAKMKEAAVLEMYFNALPEIVKNAAAPLGQVDKIVMYGEGNGSKLVGDVINTTSQVTEGLTEATGIDIRALLAGFLGGKIAASGDDSPNA